MGFWNRIKTASQDTGVIKKKTDAEIVSDLIRSIKKNIIQKKGVRYVHLILVSRILMMQQQRQEA